jgi:transcription antitermination factor NusG
MAYQWYCVQTKPRAEFFARSQLERQGFETLLITETRTRKLRNGHSKEYLASLFGNYLFVAFDAAYHHWWRRICHTYGVRRLFSSSPEQPIPIPDHTMESLRRCLTKEDQQPDHRIHPGCVARVISGPLTSRTEQTVGVCKWTRGQRAALLIDMMQGSIEVTFDISNLEYVP